MSIARMNVSDTNNKTIQKSGLAIVRENKLLLARSQSQTVFQIPGGKIENGETAIDALIRESREELNIELQPDTLVNLATFTAEAAGKPGISVEVQLFSANYTGEPLPTSEIEEICWHEIDQDKPDATVVVRDHILPFLRKQKVSRTP